MSTEKKGREKKKKSVEQNRDVSKREKKRQMKG